VRKNSVSAISANIRLAAAVVLIVVGACRQPASQSATGLPQRIVSLAPSITETLFSLGLGERVVGVTRYCTWPPQTAEKTVIGGYSDANLEKILTLHPDLVLCAPEHEKQRRYLERFSIHVITVSNATCAEVCTTFSVIGRYCGVTSAADSLIEQFRVALGNDALNDSAGRPKVLFCVGRDNPGTGTITTMFVAGRNTFYDDLIEAAGGKNAFHDLHQQFLRISLEGVLAAEPDIIIDMSSSMENAPCSLMTNDWRSLDRVPAVRNNRIHCLMKPYATLPGPRLLLLLDDLKHIIAGGYGDGQS